MSKLTLKAKELKVFQYGVDAIPDWPFMTVDHRTGSSFAIIGSTVKGSEVMVCSVSDFLVAGDDNHIHKYTEKEFVSLFDITRE